MDETIIDSMCYENVNYNPEGSIEVHTIKHNSTNVLVSCGFKINIGNTSTLQCSANKCSQIKNEKIKCLKSWTIIKKSSLKYSGLYEIKGKVNDQKNTNVSGKIHNAGFITKVIKKDLIKTTKGKYCLISPPAELKSEISKRFYTFWMVFGGFPKKFKELLKELLTECTRLERRLPTPFLLKKIACALRECGFLSSFIVKNPMIKIVGDSNLVL